MVTETLTNKSIQVNKNTQNNNKNTANNTNEEAPYVCHLSKETQELARRELGETPKLRKKAIQEVRKWILTQPHLRTARVDANFLLRFLRMQKFDIPASCSILEKYLAMRCQHPAWFQDLDCQDPSLAALVASGYIMVLPDRDQHGRRVIFSRAAAFDPAKFNTSHMMRAHIMTFETLLQDEENQVRGFTYVFEEKGVTWSQLSIWSPSEVSKAFSCCERALPMRHRGIHFLHLPWTMSLIFQFAKSLLSEKLRSRFQTHASLQSLQGHVEASVLPQEYGGTRPLAQCVALWQRELAQARTSLTHLDSMQVQQHEHQAIHRNKSKPDPDSGAQVLGMIGNLKQVKCQR